MRRMRAARSTGERTPAPETLTLTLRALGRHGEALAETDDGKPVFVFGGIPGETVTAEVVATRRGYVAARVTDVADQSPDRVEPACRYFGACTGCQWQHVAYERQLEMKREALADALHRVGGLDVEPLPTLPSPDTLGYRNHARFTVSKQGGRLGYVHKERRRHVEVEECLLMAPWINHALASLQGHVAETTQLSLRYGVHTGDYLLQPTFQNMDVPLASGQKHYHEALLGHRFRVSSPSFFQVNTRQAERMAELVMGQLRLDGSQTVVDAYAGVATFAVLMADRARRVVAVEESAAAVADARVNVEGVPNVELRQARTEDVLAELAEGGVDAVLLDPPRSGCMSGTLDALLDMPPERVVYVSCDPETLARDLAVLTSGPFRIEQVRPVDMFPQTYHVEAVATLVRDDERLAVLRARETLVLASSSPRRTEILGRLGLTFETAEPGVDEPDAPPGADPVEVARERALAKAPRRRRTAERGKRARRGHRRRTGRRRARQAPRRGGRGADAARPARTRAPRRHGGGARRRRDRRGGRGLPGVAGDDARLRGRRDRGVRRIRRADGQGGRVRRAGRGVRSGVGGARLPAERRRAAGLRDTEAGGAVRPAAAPASPSRCVVGAVARAGALPGVRGAGAPETRQRTQQAMNILGVGNLEIIWILLLALVLLGPGRMVDAARTLGKFWREAQHVLRAAADAATVSIDAPPGQPSPSPSPTLGRGDEEGNAPEGAVAREHPHPNPLPSRERGPGGDAEGSAPEGAVARVAPSP